MNSDYLGYAGYSDYSSSGINPEGLGAILLVGGVLILFIAIISLIFYLFMAIGLYKMAKNRNIENAWLAFIPILQLYILGKLAGKVTLGNFEVPSPELVLPLAPLAISFLSVIPFINLFAYLCWPLYMVVYYATLYYIFKKYSPDNVTVLLIFTILTGGIIVPFYFFAQRNKLIAESDSASVYTPPVFEQSAHVYQAETPVEEVKEEPFQNKVNPEQEVSLEQDEQKPQE